ncbi:NAD-dependent malic enzyme [Acidisphaera sp. L21]|uniref:NAD-dependent malic enzyme n=1 Tax=Acidisphaera sp. L21 TaxID=1641851 RepID=UPI00131B419C|nr:NAD-dependent malic enzyme [Acidisphaera sp. L21]
MDQLVKASANAEHGLGLLNDHVLTHGTAFTVAERRQHGLEGLLPHAVETLERQAERVEQQLAVMQTDLDRYIYLIDLADRNETLFYHVVMSDPARFIPVLYDPTIAEACLKFGHIYRRARGMYITRDMKGRMAEVLRNWPVADVRVICVSTGGRILGLGDIGANGMGIPIGKLQLYTACAGVPPDSLLPVLFDIGTTNAALRADPLYLGIRDVPPTEAELDELVEEFVQAVQTVFPQCLLHFEDWKGTDAIRILARYKDKILCHDDDIQGTGAIVLAGLTTALQILNAQITDQKVFFLGAGSAAIGIADLIMSAMRVNGLTDAEARSQIMMFDTQGVVVTDRAGLAAQKRPFAHKMAATKPFNHLDVANESPQIVAAIEAFKPTMLIGVSTVQNLFTRHIVETMSRLNKRPILFSLSNPTEKTECLPQDAYAWSKGQVLYAAGVQFPDVTIDGKTFHPGQANNFYIYPAIGLAVHAARPKLLTDECFIVAAQAMADQVSDDLRAMGRLFPSQSNILETEVTTAVRVAEFMFDKGLAQVERPADIRAWIEAQLYTPTYAR